MSKPIPWRIIAALSSLIVMLFNVPWLPESFAYEVDSSWLMVLHESVHQSWVFGRDLLWHYGPLGFLFNKVYHPETYGYLLAIWAVLSLLFVWAALPLAQKGQNPTVLLGSCVIVCLTHDAFFFSWAVIFLITHFFLAKSSSPIRPYMLVAILACISLVKISYLVLGVWCILLVDLDRFLRKGSYPTYSLWFALCSAAMWMGMGQPISAYPDFIYWALEQSRGFSAMDQEVKDSAGIIAILFCFVLGSVILLSCLFFTWWKTTSLRQALLLLAGLGGLFYMITKVGFINTNSHHILQTVASFFLVLLLTREFFWDDLAKPGQYVLGGYLGVIVLLFASQFIVSDQENIEAKHRYETVVAQLAASDVDMGGAMAEILLDKRASYDGIMADIRDRNQFPEHLRGTADIYSYHQTALAAHAGLTYQPRPSLQGYHAYTEKLAQANADFLASDKAPQHLFFSIDPMLDQFAQQHDAASWQNMMRYYTIKGLYGSHLHLERNTNEMVNYTSEIDVFTSSKKVKMGEVLPVPALAKWGRGNAIWMRYQIKDTMLNRALSFLYKPGRIYVRVTTDDGYSTRYRLNPALAKQGFVISPIITDATQFARMAALEDTAGVKEIRFEYDDVLGISGEWLYQPDIMVDFRAWHVASTPLDGIEGWNEQIDALSTLAAHPLEAPRGDIVITTAQHYNYDGDYGRSMLRIAGNSAFRYPLTGDETAVSVAFGMFKQMTLGELKPPSEGITFSITGVKASGEQILLDQAQLGPLAKGESAIIDDFTIALSPEHHFTALVFKTTPVDDTQSNWSFWGNLSVEKPE